MRVLFDDQVYSMMTHGGVARYHYELIKALRKIEVETNLPLFFSNNYYIHKRDVSSHISSLPFNLRIFNKTLPRFNRYCSKRAIIKQDFDVFHPTSYALYFLEKLQCKPFVVTVHDMITEIYDKNNDINKVKKELILKANKIIAISENTKKDILNFVPIDEKKIDVVYHGNTLVDDGSHLIGDTKNNNPYFLYVGGRQQYKNFEFLIKAFSVISHKYQVRLICTGSNFTLNEMKMLHKYHIENLVESSIIKSDSEMCQLYKNAICLIYPSLYEGFGMPILEAFACKCPVLLSDTSCFPEIARDAGLYFSPFNLDSLIHSMEQILQDDLLKDLLIRKGREREKQFSWNITAKQTLEVYESVL